VTGVAGYVVLAEHIDGTVSSTDVFYRSLGLATESYGYALDDGIRQTLAREWEVSVGRVANVRISSQDVTATVWPLWVQLQ
jgi:hypothetical protein